MEKTILIPIDFNVECLNTLKLALRKNEERKCNVVLMCPYVSSSSITELMFNPPHKIIRSLRTREFDDALSIIKNRFERSIKRLRLDLFSGHNLSAFRLFIEGNKIEEIYIPKNYALKPKNGFDPLPLIRKSGLPVYEMDWDSNTIVYPLHQLGPLFSN